MPDLIRLIHKSAMGVAKIVNAFRTHWGAKVSMNSPNPPPNPLPDKVDSTPKSTSQYANASGISKRQLEKRIQAIATKEARPPHSKPMWYVNDSVMKQYGLSQENLTPLVPDSSPILSPKYQPLSKTPESAGTILKRKNNRAGKSLLQFLSRSPLAPSPKRRKCEVSGRGRQEDVIILDPLETDKNNPPQQQVIILDPPISKESEDAPLPPASSADEALATPLAKRPCLEEPSSNIFTTKAPDGTNISQDNTLNVLHSTANQVLLKELLSV